MIAKSDTGVGLAPENPDDIFGRFVSKGDSNLGTSIEASSEAERIVDVPEAQLRAALNMIPAHAWYATPSGGLTVNERCADYFGLPKDHPLRFGAGMRRMGVTNPILHPDDQEETQSVVRGSGRAVIVK